MNKIITYSGNADDLFAIELIEKVQAKCPMSGKTKNAEHWGDANDSNTEDHFEFGAFGEIAMFEVYKEKIKIFTPHDIVIGRDPMTGHFNIYEDYETFSAGHYSADVSVVFIHYRPRTMGALMACYEAFVLNIYQEALRRHVRRALKTINYHNSLRAERNEQE